MTDLSETALDIERVEPYLKSLLGNDVRVLRLLPLGEAPEHEVKGFGYGTPVRVDYQGADRATHSVVIHTVSPGPFGHENMSDRARILLWSHQAFNRLPTHVRSLDVGGIDANGDLISVGGVEEFCVLTEYAEGEAYALDLERMRDAGELRDLELPAPTRCATTWLESTARRWITRISIFAAIANWSAMASALWG